MAIVNPTIFGKGGGIESVIVVTVESGSTVTAVNGANVLTAIADETGARLKLTVPGIWAVSATLNGKTSVSKTVVVPEEYPLTLRFETTIVKSDKNLTMYQSRSYATGASVGEYALFVGGTTVVEAFDRSLTRVVLSSLDSSRDKLTSCVIGNHAIFMGGDSAIVEVYDDTLTRTTLTTVNNYRVKNGAGTTVAGYALFGFYSGVYAYDTDLIATLVSSTGLSLTDLAAASAGNYALFAGGYNSTATIKYTSGVRAYDEFLTAATQTDLSLGRCALAGASIGDYALFAGGRTSNSTNVADAYDGTLVKTTPDTLASKRGEIGTIVIGEHALLGGGDPWVSASDDLSTVDLYDYNLVHSTITELSVGTAAPATATVGNYALFVLSSSDGKVDVYIAE